LGRIEIAIAPLQILLVFFMVGICNCLQEFVVSRYTTHILRWAGILSSQAFLQRDLVLPGNPRVVQIVQGFSMAKFFVKVFSK
jgi:hypothetical protein